MMLRISHMAVRPRAMRPASPGLTHCEANRSAKRRFLQVQIRDVLWRRGTFKARFAVSQHVATSRLTQALDPQTGKTARLCFETHGLCFGAGARLGSQVHHGVEYLCLCSFLLRQVNRFPVGSF